MKKWKQIVAIVMTVAVLIGMTPMSAWAEVNASAMCQDTVAVVNGTVTDAVTSSNGWAIMTTARAGQLTAEQADAYYENLEALLKEQNNSLLTESTSANIVAILAVTAIGKDATNVGGYNLLEPLADMNYCTSYVTTGAMALIALDSKNYTIPTVAEGGTQTTREDLIQYLLDQRNSTGTWGYSFGGTDYASVDTIGIVIQALAPYYDSNADVKTAVDAGLTAMAQQQGVDGGFGSACSAAQVLVALTSLGINPLEDTQFIKDGATVLDGLSVNYVQGEGFTGWDGNIDLSFSTPQAAYALVANERYQNQQNSLYDMTDAVAIVPAPATTTEEGTTTATTEATTGTTEVATTTEVTEASTTATTGTVEATTAVTEATTATNSQSPKTGDAMPMVFLFSVTAFAAAGLVLVNRQKRG